MEIVGPDLLCVEDGRLVKLALLKVSQLLFAIFGRQTRGGGERVGGKSEISFPLCLSSLSRAGKEQFLRMFLQCFLQCAADTPTRGGGGGTRSICLTGVIESVSNYYRNWRACFTVELPVKQVGRKPEPVKARQSKETRSVGLMDFSTPLCLRTQRSRQGGDWGVGGWGGWVD